MIFARKPALVAEKCESSLEEDAQLDLARRVLRAHLRFAVRHRHVEPVLDVQRLRELEPLGLHRGRGEIFRTLAYSLLQRLMRFGFLSEEITISERELACAENRRRLAVGPAALRPHRRDAFTGENLGEDPDAFLHHDIHAEPSGVFHRMVHEKAGFAGGWYCASRAFPF